MLEKPRKMVFDETGISWQGVLPVVNAMVAAKEGTETDLIYIQATTDGELIVTTAGGAGATEATLQDVKDAVELIDDAVYSDGVGTPVKGLLVMGTDGTNPQVLSVNSDGELKVNLETADIHIGAVEIKDSATDVRVEVSDANTARTTGSKVLSVQNIDADGEVPDWSDLKDTKDSLAAIEGVLKSNDTDQVVVRVQDSTGTEFNPAKEDGNLADILAALQTQLYAEQPTHTSPNDFTAAYTSSTTITLTGYPAGLVSDEQVVYIVQLKADNTYQKYVNGDNCYIAFSAGVLTIYGAGTPFVTGDSYRVGIKLQDKAYDASIDSLKTSEQSPEKDWYTDPVILVSEQNLTATEDDLGSVIDVRGFKTLILYIAADCNDSVDCTLYAYTLPTSDGSEYTSQDAGFSSSVALWTGTGTDFLHEYRLDVEAHAFVQLKAKHTSNSGTTGDLTVQIAKRY